MNGTVRESRLMKLPSKRKVLGVVAAVLLLSLWFWRYPLFRVVPLSEARAQKTAHSFDAAGAAQRFWTGQLRPAAARATDAKDLLGALERDASGARRRFGRTFGISDRTLFFFTGTAQVVAVEPDAVVLSLEGASTQIRLRSGLVFGTCVRDASGLLDVGAHATSRDFNDLSVQLNQLVEREVTPSLRDAAPGRRVRFAACTELGAAAPPKSLAAVPIQVAWL